jgi:hypothetical protein
MATPWYHAPLPTYQSPGRTYRNTTVTVQPQDQATILCISNGSVFSKTTKLYPLGSPAEQQDATAAATRWCSFMAQILDISDFTYSIEWSVAG